MDLESSIVKFETLCGGCNIIHKNYYSDTNSRKKNYLIGFTRQQAFADESLGLARAKRDSTLLVEIDDNCSWFPRGFLLFSLGRMTTSDPDNAEIATVQYFTLTPLPGSVINF